MSDDLRDVRSLVADPKNRRTHPSRNVDMMRDSLRSVGAARSIVIDEDDVVLAGNGVTAAALAAGITNVRIIEASGEELIAVRRRGLTDDQKRALALYDNRTAELAEWNFEQLAADKDAGMLLQPFWTAEEEAVLLAGRTKAGRTAPDSVPARRPTDIQPGDLFELGAHRLLCGDATDAAAVARLMGDEHAAFSFTSPPYTDQRAYEGTLDLSVEHLATFVRVAADRVRLFAVNLGLARKDGEIVCYWNHYIDAARACGLRLLSWNVWKQGVQGSVGKLTAMFPIEHEFIFVFGRERVALNETVPNLTAGHIQRPSDRQRDGSTMKKPSLQIRDHRELSTVIDVPPELDRDDVIKDHPARFPVALVTPYLEACSGVRAIVYEPFAGSGTTLIACEQLERHCRALEIEPSYAQMIVDRWEAFTGEHARKVSAE